jgi:hypothetical protein
MVFEKLFTNCSSKKINYFATLQEPHFLAQLHQKDLTAFSNCLSAYLDMKLEINPKSASRIAERITYMSHWDHQFDTTNYLFKKAQLK